SNEIGTTRCCASLILTSASLQIRASGFGNIVASHCRSTRHRLIDGSFVTVFENLALTPGRVSWSSDWKSTTVSAANRTSLHVFVEPANSGPKSSVAFVGFATWHGVPKSVTNSTHLIAGNPAPRLA